MCALHHHPDHCHQRSSHMSARHVRHPVVPACCCGVWLAGINKNSAAEDTDEADWDATFAINTKGVFLCCQVGR